MLAGGAALMRLTPREHLEHLAGTRESAALEPNEETRTRLQELA
jgi:hypothetical protein